MNNMSGNPRGNLSGPLRSAESEAAQLVARARLMMIVAALTTALAIAAVAAVVGYRMMGLGGGAITDSLVTLPKGARVISTAASSGRFAVLLEINGETELRTFDVKTLKQVGALRFTTEP